jgi:hypothetical protein
VYEQSRRGRIPTVTLGRYRRYRREAIERWLDELEAGEGQRGQVWSGRASIPHGTGSTRQRVGAERGLSVTR